jgi:DNA-binding response OmpR family regulator
MKYKILMIDDDKDYVEAVRFILESQGYEFVPAYSTKDGFAKVTEEKPDLIILDVMMDRKAAGFIFARKLRRDAQYSEVSKTPILMLTAIREKTGFFFPGEIKDDYFLPVDEFVEKPVKAERLVAIVDGLLKKRAKEKSE